MKDEMQALGACRGLRHMSWTDAVQNPSETVMFTVWAMIRRMTCMVGAQRRMEY